MPFLFLLLNRVIRHWTGRVLWGVLVAFPATCFVEHVLLEVGVKLNLYVEIALFVAITASVAVWKWRRKLRQQKA